MNIFGKLRKSEKRILGLLTNSKSKVTQKEIINSTKLSPRAVKYGLRRLITLGCLIEKCHFADMRFKFYSRKVNLNE